ncbi:AraC family transcriptional regulator [Rhizorhabdus histidinilytica]|jgi:AraC-like DNA-binding protein|uniref:Transcriptional regulator, AraC family n=1 Tax=Rhizorhabdus histidinilytica TaxID=439228 RepID=A0A1T5GTG7_9SPHN|nr:AraC family transcriptional regulator [Rhizorhabdus histidinilytica]SKC11610.1 transcriptional regulator, AraC family [Rhizorhabdus histidinilytica]
MADTAMMVEGDIDEANARVSLVRADILRLYPEVVRRLGGDPDALLARESISASIFEQKGAMISYRRAIRLLHHTAIELNCPDFGMIFASFQGGTAVLGPLEVAMSNAPTLGDAYRYCAEHLRTYSPASELSLENERGSGRPYIRWAIRLDRLPHQEQAIEQGMALMHHAIGALSGGTVRTREVWFAHDHISAPSRYSHYFGARVEMNAPFNAIFLNRADLAAPIANRNQQLYDMATAFIDTQFPSSAKPLSARVRSVAAQLLSQGGCLHIDVAAALGMHPRTMQRRLSEEGVSFEEIKDEVRRDAAIRYLGQRTIPLTRVAAMLGYSEPSVLTRSCHRWFGSSPRKFRKAMASGVSG